MELTSSAVAPISETLHLSPENLQIYPTTVTLSEHSFNLPSK